MATAANVLKRLAAFFGDVLLQELGAWELDISALTTDDGVGGASAGVAEIKVPVTQAEAEAGTNTRFSFWSSERVKQAIAAQANTLAIEMVRSDNVSSNAVSVTWPSSFPSAPSVVTSYFTTSTASRDGHCKTSSTTGATLFGTTNAEPLDVLGLVAT